MSFERDAEDVIWGKKDWNEYVSELIRSDSLDESILLERIEVVKDGIGRQLRKAVEQNHSRLVEQAGALQGLDSACEVISSEMTHLYVNAETLSKRFAFTYQQLMFYALQLERLYAMNRTVSALNRCEKLLNRLKTLNELVRRTETICELQDVIQSTAPLADILHLRDTLLDTVPRVSKECRKSTIEQLKSSLQTLHSPMVQCCIRALHNLNCYDVEMNATLDEESHKLDAEFLKLSANPGGAAKSLPALVGSIQSTLEQFSLLDADIATKMSERIANIIRVRLPENAPYAARFLHQVTVMLKRTIATQLQPIHNALKPLKIALISHALDRLFEVVNKAFHDPQSATVVVDQVNGAIREQLSSVSWDAELTNDMESSIIKTIELCAIKIENMLILDDDALQISANISAVQLLNYTLLNVAHLLTVSWRRYSAPLSRVMGAAHDAILNVAKRSVCTILLSLHDEPLASTVQPSPYARELVQYLLSATLVRPIDDEKSNILSRDLLHIAETLKEFGEDELMLDDINNVANALLLPAEQLVNSPHLPFWAVVQLLICQCESSILSPPESTNWTKLEYVKWFMTHTDVERRDFLKSLMDFYTRSVLSNNRTEFVRNYHFILHVLNVQPLDK
ncbi:unnamed protein product [Anisakis simplex]|uniref:Conserved oligomeric Golgi complex subunit 5 n=1 Tax=Anisakis simplex TaxID=6269 RepID=A0A0M3JRC7_ANISI|nr:unnamed protein product [Anisakis simplex]